MLKFGPIRLLYSHFLSKDIRIWGFGLTKCQFIPKAFIFVIIALFIIWTPYNGMPRNLGFIHYDMLVNTRG